MQMAPLELMPHSVYMFLEMVHAGLFDGCSFILNAMHVIKAAPLPYDGSSASAKVKAFTKLGLESVRVARLQNRRKLLPDDVAHVCSHREQFLFLKDDLQS